MNRFTEKDKEWFYSQEKIQIEDAVNTKNCSFYRLKNTEQLVFQVNLFSNSVSEKKEIAFITDSHIDFTDETDNFDSEVVYTHSCRKWLPNAIGILPLSRALQGAKFADQIVIGGDMLDYLSHGAQVLVERHLFNKYENLLCAVGGHDLKKEIQTKKDEALPIEEREKIVASFWPHDIFYKSIDISKEITLIALNNNFGVYNSYQLEHFNAEIARARKEKRIILIFQHEPISTGNPNDKNVLPLWSFNNHSSFDFYNKNICGPDSDTVTAKLYNTITENDDIIKGIFCGHLHDAFSTEIISKNGLIPQFACPATPYRSQVGIYTRIIIQNNNKTNN